MADKLEQGISVDVTFVDGETPSAAKLSAITAQMRNAADALERAVGDIHDQSYPYSTATKERLSIAYGRSDDTTSLSGADGRPLDIASIARLIGPASALNPGLLPGLRDYTEDVPADTTAFSFRYPPASIAPWDISFTKTAPGEAFQTRHLDASLFTGAGGYYVDGDGRVSTAQATDASDPGTVTYKIDPESWFGGPSYMGGRFNVMPGPNQLSAGGAGCAIGALDGQNRRPVTLPTVTHSQMNESMDSVTLDATDPNFGEQLVLPAVITGYTVGDVIPSGFLLLKNWTTGEVYDTATYYYNGEKSVLIGGVDITAEVLRGDDFAIVTVGTDITTSVDDLRRKMRHAHDRTFGEPLVPAASLTDWTAGPWGARGGYVTSAIEANYAPQYLNRYGYQSGENLFNDYNCMRGDLLIGQYPVSVGEDGQIPGKYVGTTSGTTTTTSYKLAFSHPDVAYMYMDRQTNTLHMVSAITGGAVEIEADGDITLDSEDDILLDAVDNVAVTAGTDFTVAVGNSINAQVTNRVVFDCLSTTAGNPAFYISADTSTADSILELAIDGNFSTGERFVEFADDGGRLGSIRAVNASAPAFGTSGALYAWDSSGGGLRVDVPAGGGAQYVSGNSDFAEYVLVGNLDEWELEDCEVQAGIPVGTIVYVRDMALWRDGPGSPMLVSRQACIVGNAVPEEMEKKCELLSFIGQVPAMCHGPCESGDYLIPEGNHVVAVSPDKISFTEHLRVIGTAWTSKTSEEPGLVLCAVGKK